MARYLVRWELDESRLPDEPGKRKAAWLAAVNEVKNDIKSGLIKDWGSFVGVTAGFSVNEGTEEEVYGRLLKYIPLCRLKVYPLVSMEQGEQQIKKLA